MILNEFFNLPQVFEKDMTEGTGQDSKSWMASIRQQHPDVKFIQAKMLGAPIIALVNGKPVAQFDTKKSVEEDGALDKFRSRIGTQGNIQRQNQRHQDWMDAHHQSSLDRMTNHRDAMNRLSNAGVDDTIARQEIRRERMKKDDDDWDKTFDVMRDRLNRYQWSSQKDNAEQGVAEGSLGKVLSFPDLLGQVKHILDAKHRSIGWKMSKRDDDVFLFSAMNDYDVRSMLVVAKDRDGWVSATNGIVDPYGEVEMFDKQELPMTLASASEIADEAISTYHDIDLSDYADEDEQGVAEGIFGSKPSPVLPMVDKIAKVAGGLTPQNLEVGKQIIQANARDITRILSPQAKAGIDVIEGTRERLSNLHDKIRKEKDLPDPKEYLKIAQQKKKEIADLKAQDKKEVGEAKDDYVPPKEADYGPEYQAMVKRVGEKARAQEKAKQQQPKQPVRESRRALLKQIIQS